MADTLEAPVTTPETQTGGGDGDHDRFSHIIRKEDEMKGYFGGEPIEALCGKKWVPSRDPHRYPLCPGCKEAMERIRSSGSN